MNITIIIHSIVFLVKTDSSNFLPFFFVANTIENHKAKHRKKRGREGRMEGERERENEMTARRSKKTHKEEKISDK